LVTELDVIVADDTTVARAGEVANTLEQALVHHLSALKAAHIKIEPFDARTEEGAND